MNKKKCDCSDCHKADDMFAAIKRLEDRDEANARIINEMYAKIVQLSETVDKFIRLQGPSKKDRSRSDKNLKNKK